MKITVSPLARLIEVAELRINMRFAIGTDLLAHQYKRMLALAVLAGAGPSAEFVEAAAIEGCSVDDLAAVIAAKPDDVMQRDNQRRAAIRELRAAKTLAEIDRVLNEAGVPLIRTMQ